MRHPRVGHGSVGTRPWAELTDHLHPCLEPRPSRIAHVVLRVPLSCMQREAGTIVCPSPRWHLQCLDAILRSWCLLQLCGLLSLQQCPTPPASCHASHLRANPHRMLQVRPVVCPIVQISYNAPVHPCFLVIQFVDT